MNTLKERFENWSPTLPEHLTLEEAKVMDAEILAFFQAELLALAEEVKSKKKPPTGLLSDCDPWDAGNDAGLDDAAVLIRSKADELN